MDEQRGFGMPVYECQICGFKTYGHYDRELKMWKHMRETHCNDIEIFDKEEIKKIINREF